MNERRDGQARSIQRAMVLLVIALVGALTTACAPPAPQGPSADEQFCEFWDRVQEAPPTHNHSVLVKEDVVALADETDVVGEGCTTPGATIELDGAVLAEGEEIPSEPGNPASPPFAAITGPEVAAQAPVFDNLKITSLSAQIGWNGIRVRGSAAITLSGTTSSIGFVGTMTDLANWSVTLSSGAFSIPGITTAPAQFTGTLRVSNGDPSLTLNASVSSAKIGDVEVSGAGIVLRISPSGHVFATVEGAIRVGPSTARGVLDVAFDQAGGLVAMEADLAVHLVGALPGNKRADLQGVLTLEGDGDDTVASFSGSGVYGDLFIHAASGSLELRHDEAMFTGILDVAEGSTYVRYNGAIVWDGEFAHMPFMELEAGGEYSGTLSDGQNVAVRGDVSVEVIGGQVYTTVTGDFEIGRLKATGSAIVEDDGGRTVLEVSADLVAAGFDATIEGLVEIEDGEATFVELSAHTDSVQLGDLRVDGASLTISSSAGRPLDIEASGRFRVGSQVDVSGAVAAKVGTNGKLLSLRGKVAGSLRLDEWNVRNVDAELNATGQQLALKVKGDISGGDFPKATPFSGSLSSTNGGRNWTLKSELGYLRIDDIWYIENARVTLTAGKGMRTVRAPFEFYFLGFIPMTGEMDYYALPEGGCEKVEIRSANLHSAVNLPIHLPGRVGCPVRIM